MPRRRAAPPCCPAVRVRTGTEVVHPDGSPQRSTKRPEREMNRG